MAKKTALVMLFFCVPLCLVAETAGKKETPALSSLQKSLLIPGWGQAAEKHYAEGILFFAGEVFCLYGFFDQNHRGNESYALYRAAESREDAVRFRRKTELFDTRRNRFLLAAAAVWALNLADICWIVSGHGHDRSGRTISLRLECGENQSLAVALSYRY